MHFEVFSKYHYSRLSNYGKRIYIEILKAIYSFKKEIVFRLPLKMEKFNDIIIAFNYDIPEIFYIDLSSLSIISGFYGFRVLFEYLYSEYGVEKIKSRILDIVREIQNQCNKTSLQETPEKLIHDFIVNHIQYSDEGKCKDSCSIKGAFIDGGAVCEGFAFSFKLFCDFCKIHCIIVIGDASKTIALL